MKKLNTMDSFEKGFKIEREGKVYTLTPEEMSDFHYLKKACTGREYLKWASENYDVDMEIIQELMNDEEACYTVYDICNEAKENDGHIFDIENLCIRTYIEANSKKTKRVV